MPDLDPSASSSGSDRLPLGGYIPPQLSHDGPLDMQLAELRVLFGRLDRDVWEIRDGLGDLQASSQASAHANAAATARIEARVDQVVARMGGLDRLEELVAAQTERLGETERKLARLLSLAGGGVVVGQLLIHMLGIGS